MNYIVDFDVFKELELYKKMYSTLFNGTHCNRKYNH